METGFIKWLVLKKIKVTNIVKKEYLSHAGSWLPERKGHITGVGTPRLSH